MIITVFCAATLRTFFFAFHAGAKELSCFKVLECRQKLLWRLEIEGLCKVQWLKMISGM